MRLNLLIADADGHYAENLARYLRHAYAARFNIVVFSRLDPLLKFLETGSGNIDAILADRQFFGAAGNTGAEYLRMLLWDGRPHEYGDATFCLNRFHSGEEIACKIMEFYSAIHKESAALLNGNRNTKIAVVVSPYGGSGKTTAARCISRYLSASGFAVMYLNLETCSTCTQNEGWIKEQLGLSSVLLQLKSRSNSLSARLHPAGGVRDGTVAAFSRADCPVELDELETEDLEQLIELIRTCGHFDFVLVDTDTVFNRFMSVLLGRSDAVLMMIDGNSHASGKLDAYTAAVSKIFGKGAAGVFGKTAAIINKSMPGESTGIKIPDTAAAFYVPLDGRLYSSSGDGYAINTGSKAYACFQEIGRYVSGMRG